MRVSHGKWNRNISWNVFFVHNLSCSAPPKNTSRMWINFVHIRLAHSHRNEKTKVKRNWLNFSWSDVELLFRKCADNERTACVCVFVCGFCATMNKISSKTKMFETVAFFSQLELPFAKWQQKMCRRWTSAKENYKKRTNKQSLRIYFDVVSMHGNTPTTCISCFIADKGINYKWFRFFLLSLSLLFAHSVCHCALAHESGIIKSKEFLVFRFPKNDNEMSLIAECRLWHVGHWRKLHPFAFSIAFSAVYLFSPFSGWFDRFAVNGR